MNPVREAKDIEYPPAPTTVVRGPSGGITSRFVGYYVLRRETIDEVIAWTQSVPVFTGSVGFEIRLLDYPWGDKNEETKKVIVNHTVACNEKLVHAGKLKRDDDGTWWRKVENDNDEEEARLVAEAEKHSEILNPTTQLSPKGRI